MGHRMREAGIRTTERYAAHAPDYLSEARAAVDAMFGDLKGLLKGRADLVSCDFRVSRKKSAGGKSS